MSSQLPLTANNPDKASLLTPDEFRALVAHVRRNTNRVDGLGCAAIIINAIAVVFGLGWWLWFREDKFLPIVIPVVFVNALMTRLFAHRVRKDANQVERLIRFIENTQDARQLGTILDLDGTAGHPGGIWQKVYKAARGAVIRLLPLLQPSHADTLNSRQRERLRRDLYSRAFGSNQVMLRNNASSLPLLYALEQIGDKRDLPDVEQLLKYKTLTDEVRAAAERCAQTIRERLANENARDFLLRADRKPEAVETLLRPSSEKADTPPQQLLRAATSDAPDPPV
jgi:hypothetical protein